MIREIQRKEIFNTLLLTVQWASNFSERTKDHSVFSHSTVADI